MRKALIIDVETIDIRRLDIFELAYSILDLDEGTLEATSFLIEEVYNTDLFKQAYFYEKNKEEYIKMLEKKETKIVTIKEAREALNKIIKENDIRHVSAFNMQFDIRAMNFTFQKYNAGGKHHINYETFHKRGIKTIDSAILFALIESSNPCYRCFCEKNGFYTKTPEGKLKNIRTTAEIVYRYIINDIHFEEQHTGYMDSQIEADIFQYSISRCLKKPELIEKAQELTIKGSKPYLIFKNAKK